MKSIRRKLRRKARKASAGGFMRSRSNPAGTTVLLANPHRRRRRKLRKAKSNPLKRRHFKIRRHRVASNPTFAPKRRRRHRMASNPMKRFHLRRRHVRANPVTISSWTQIVGIFVAGGVGIIFARVVANAYDEHVSKHVLGDEGQVNPKSWRGIANEFVRAIVSGAAVVFVGRAAAKAKLPSMYAGAFVMGGGGEVARQTVGRAIALMSPQTNLKRIGLDGPDAIEDDLGRVWVLTPDGRYMPADAGGGQLALGDIETDDSFAGLGDIETDDAFAGVPRY